jgi:hypothetical protein
MRRYSTIDRTGRRKRERTWSITWHRTRNRTGGRTRKRTRGSTSKKDRTIGWKRYETRESSRDRTGTFDTRRDRSTAARVEMTR